MTERIIVGADGRKYITHEPEPEPTVKQSLQVHEPEPVAWDDCRSELVAAVYSIASDYENALGAFGKDVEARRKAEGDIAHARKIAAKWNWNGRAAAIRARREQ